MRVRACRGFLLQVLLPGTECGHALHAPFVQGWQPGAADAVISFAFCSQKATVAPAAICHIGRSRRLGTARPDWLASGAEEVALAELHAVVAQDGVGGRDVEEHVGNRPALQKSQSLELEGALANGHLDVARLRSFERTRRHALQVVDGARDAGAQLLDGGLVVLEAW